MQVPLLSIRMHRGTTVRAQLDHIDAIEHPPLHSLLTTNFLDV